MEDTLKSVIKKKKSKSQLPYMAPGNGDWHAAKNLTHNPLALG